MNHPSDATLALYAGNDLKWFARRRAERHLDRCERCRSEVDAYSGIRDAMPAMAEAPGLAWNRLAAEMKANIRLGLSAGECVREREQEPAPAMNWFGARALVAYASIAALVTVSVLLERPTPRVRQADGVTLQATAEGIQMRGGGGALSLLHRGAEDARDVTFSAGAQGSMRARYVDSETGYVTINNVYAQ